MTSKLRQLGLVGVGVVAGILVSLHISVFADRETPVSLPIEELRTFAEVFNAIKQGYVEPVEDKKLITNAISGMLSNLDPHSAYLDADAFKDLQVGTQGEFGGLGLEVGMEDGLVKVVAPIEDSPAYRIGIKAGDLIFKLDEALVKGMTLSEAVKRMRGKPKTTIKLGILRKGEAKPLEFVVTREVIRVQSVKSKLVEPGLGYLRITSFQENTGASLVQHYNDLVKAGPLRGLVLDLRNDPGGLLNAAVGVSAAFLPPKTLVTSTDGRTEDAKRQFMAIPEDYVRGGAREDYLKHLATNAQTVPIVVLVNGGSASASEIVAGALQDHKRAVIMGTQTFGKGSVQSILPLPGNTAIKLTTARYYTPSGRSIQAKGIAPDIVVEESPNGDSPKRVREADLERHLENEKEKDAAHAKDTTKPSGKNKSKGNTKEGAEDKEAKDPALPLELASKDDYQLNQALNLLKGLPVIQKSPQDK